MANQKALIAGIVAGVIGAAIWAGVSYFMNLEIGWVAWGIGFLVGAAIAGASGGSGGMVNAANAVIITILSICVGKYAAIHFAIEAEFNAASGDGLTAADYSDEDALMYLADQEVQYRMDEGIEVNWPNGMYWENAVSKRDYPTDVWAVAETEWNGMSGDEKTDFKQAMGDEVMAYLDSDAMSEIKSEIRADAFKQSFGLMDIVFFVLAIGTAGKLAAGGMGEGEQ